MKLARGGRWAPLGIFAVLALVRAVRGRGSLRGRVVAISGGSRGLGLVLARTFARHGARVAIAARHPAALARARDELVDGGAEVMAMAADVTDPLQAKVFIDTVNERLGPIDVLVNNAGVIEVGPLETMSDVDYADAMATHFWAPLELVRAVLPAMRARRAGRIVNIVSIGGLVPVPHLLPYVASKFALRGLSEGLRAELAKDGVRVTTVCPGLMRTGSARNARFKGDHRAEFALFALAAASPLVSMSAERAARKIVRACERGQAILVLTLAAKAARLAHGLLPGAFAALLGVVARALPRSTDGHVHTGLESASRVAPSLLTAADERAARRNNEIGAES